MSSIMKPSLRNQRVTRYENSFSRDLRQKREMKVFLWLVVAVAVTAIVIAISG